MLVDRTVSRWRDDRWVSQGERLSDFRSAAGYVLLGEPGLGKSTAFDMEAENDGNAAKVTVRRFIGRTPQAHPEWRDATLIIDGLDEVRAGGGGLQAPLDSLVCRLEELGNPRFRLSCREDSWLGRGDLRELKSVAGSEDVHLLRLDPVTEEDVHQILGAAGIQDPDGFCWQARSRGLETFLHNPLLLDILIKAKDSGSWPEGRLAVFDRACETLAKETSQDHLDARNGYPFPVDEVVLASGRLCSILLLCGNSGWSRRGPGDEGYPVLSEAGEEQPLLKFTLDTKLFEGDAETGRRPRHRQIAEVLAARFLDRAIRDDGLPAERVLAWMQGADGVVVPDLRGLSLWLAARNAALRRRVVETDPVGVAFHGDAEGFSHAEVALLFRAVEARLEHQHSTQQWEGDSSAALGSLMAGSGREFLFDMLRAADRSQFRHRFVERLLRGLGEATQRDIRSGVPGSAHRTRGAQEALEATVRDPGWRYDVRGRALIELIWVLADVPDGSLILLGLLQDLADGTVPEDESGALGLCLLEHLYPRHLSADRLWDYVEMCWAGPPPTVGSPEGDKGSWGRRLVYRSAAGDVKALLEALVRRGERLNATLAHFDARYFAEFLLMRTVHLFGAEVVAEFRAGLKDSPLLPQAYERRATESPRHREPAQSREQGERREAPAPFSGERLAALEVGQVSSELLHELGRVYLDGYEHLGGSWRGCITRARANLGRHLGGDESLRDGVIREFRNFVTRTDLLTLEEIVGLHGDGESAPFGVPFLVGLIEEEGAGPEPFELPDEETLRRALGFFLLSRLHTRPHPLPVTFRDPEPVHLRRPKYELPGWYLRALDNDQAVVADAFVAVNLARVRAKEPPDQHLYDLAWEPEYRDVGPLALRRMLASFPSRCVRQQVLSLRAVLWAGLNHMPSDDLWEVIAARLQVRTMDPAQLATWLGAGLFVERETCVPRVVEYLSNGATTRCRHLLDFLVPDREPLLNLEWPTADLAVLIRAMGAKLSVPLDATDLRIGWKLWPLLDLWAGTLADRVDADAVAALGGLAEDPVLKNCHAELLRARDRQAVKRRVWLYRAPTIPQIRKALSGGPLVGSADLAALVCDKLRRLTCRVRDGNTDDWQQYWHTVSDDPKGRTVTWPKAEDPCRDALLSDLQLMLEPHDVDAQPEGHHAEDARSDIIAIHGVHAVVVEIKKSDSKDLWSAIDEQLIGKYARDPRSGGYGIFLVLWFGPGRLRTPADGHPPRSREELERMLDASLTDEQRRTVRVIVVDVSAPEGRVDRGDMG